MADESRQSFQEWYRKRRKIRQIKKELKRERNILLSSACNIAALSATEECVRFEGDRRRVLVFNFFVGLVRGLGMAIGFTLLGAVVLWALQYIARQNMPLIGGFIAQLVDIVQDHIDY